MMFMFQLKRVRKTLGPICSVAKIWYLFVYVRMNANRFGSNTVQNGEVWTQNGLIVSLNSKSKIYLVWETSG